MKRIITMTVVLVLLHSPVFCLTFYTPNNTAVHADFGAEFNPIDLAVFDSICIADFPNAQIIYHNTGIFPYSSTGMFNCHGYAWIGKQSGKYYWFTDPNEFWDDYSYVKTDETNAEKIFYPNEDPDNAHSVIVSSVQGYHESKFAAGPLMRHLPEDGPLIYFENSPIYYKLNPYTITGPNEVCFKGSVFTLNNYPSNIGWSVSDENIFYVGSSLGNNSNRVYRKQGSGTGNATLLK